VDKWLATSPGSYGNDMCFASSDLDDMVGFAGASQPNGDHLVLVPVPSFVTVTTAFGTTAPD